MLTTFLTPPQGTATGVLREPVSLRRLFPTTSFVGCADIRVTHATERADRCEPGMLFAARQGHSYDGAEFTAEALGRGASALMVSRPQPEAGVPQCIVPEVGRSFGVLCASLAGRPMRTVRTAGVTGTNGKTTVSWLIRGLLQNAGHACGLLGTIEYSDGTTSEPATLTTPDSQTFWQWMASAACRKTPFAAVELSSHALHQDRVAGSELELAVLTNVTHEHLDYHGTSAGYFASKAKILSLVRPGGCVVLNSDDAAIDALRPRIPAGVDVSTFAIRRHAAVTARHLRRSPAGMRFTLSLRGRSVDVETPLVGRHNVLNCLAAVAAADQFGLSVDQIVDGLLRATPPPGRMERLPSEAPFEVFVDYAHTPDALHKAIATTRSLASGRVIVVFGAGGDRDRSKRSLLGRAAGAADIAVVTSDNPRSEDPNRIIDDISAGLIDGHGETIVEPDREEAIARALGLAGPGDVVLIAGKGHETTQALAERTIPFDDRTIAASLIRERLEATPSETIAA